MSGVEIASVVICGNVIVWILIFWRIRRQLSVLCEEMKRSGDSIIVEPETGTFRGSSKHFGMIKSLGVIMLTEHMLIFRKVCTSDIRIPVSEIAKVSKNVWFLQSYHNGKEHLILKLNDGTQIGFIVKDVNRWIRELSSKMASI